MFSLFLRLFLPILAIIEATMVFLNFLNFIAIFLEFSIALRVRLKRKDKKHAKWEDSAQNTWGFVSGGLKSPSTCPQGQWPL